MQTIQTPQYSVSYTYDDGVCILESLWVNEEYRRQGYAKQAMQEFLSTVDGRIEMAVVPQDDATDLYRLVSFYQSFGFKIEYDTGTEVLMYRD